VAINGLDWSYALMELVGLASLQELAEACGIDKAALKCYFNGDVRPSIAQKTKSKVIVTFSPTRLQTAKSSFKFSFHGLTIPPYP